MAAFAALQFDPRYWRRSTHKTIIQNTPALIVDQRNRQEIALQQYRGFREELSSMIEKLDRLPPITFINATKMADSDLSGRSILALQLVKSLEHWIPNTVQIRSAIWSAKMNPGIP